MEDARKVWKAWVDWGRVRDGGEEGEVLGLELELILGLVGAIAVAGVGMRLLLLLLAGVPG